MKRLIRYGKTAVGSLALAVSLALAMNPLPAQASGLTLYVDDTPANNMGVSCPATPYTTIPAALAAMGSIKTNVTIIICPGIYTVDGGNPATFISPPGGYNGFNTLKIIGKGGPTILATNLFHGALLLFLNSTNVTVQGLGIDGGGALSGGSPAAAIVFENTTGKIIKNVISNWHQQYVAPAPYSVTTVHFGIYVYQPSPLKVAIQQNTVFDPQDYGIFVEGAGLTQIQKNRVVFSNAITPLNPPPFFLPPLTMFGLQAGISVMQQKIGGVTVANNQVQSQANLFPGGAASRGILLYETSGAKVTNNTVRGTFFAVSLESYCENPSFPNTSANVITGNKLYDNTFGLFVNAVISGGCSPAASFNAFKGNKVYTSYLLNGIGAFVGATPSATAAGNVVIGNTFGGFFPANAIIHTGDSGSVLAPNKIVGLPPAGAQSGTSTPPAIPEMGPLPPEVLQPAF